MQWIRRNLKILAPVTVVVLAGVAYLAFGVFGVHTLFIDDKVDEAGPVFDSGVAAAATDTLAPVSTEASVPPVTAAPAPSDTVSPEVTEAPPVT